MEGEGTAESTFEYAIPMILIRRFQSDSLSLVAAGTLPKISGAINRGGCREPLGVSIGRINSRAGSWEHRRSRS